MNIKEIQNKLYNWAPSNEACDSDGLIIGDYGQNVEKICVCCIATYSVIKKAVKWGAELIITHEPTFYDVLNKDDIINIKKRKLLEEHGIALFRFHDHPHFTSSDKIVEGILQKLGWAGNFDGIKKYELKNEKCLKEILTELKTKLNLQNIRYIGNLSQRIDNISMCVGAWGDELVLSELKKDDIDTVICGEVGEWLTCEYVRDLVQVGENKSIILLGHMGSEKSAMEFVAGYLSDKFPKLNIKYFDCDEVYDNIGGML